MHNAQLTIMKKNIIKIKSFDFAVRIVNLCKYLNDEKKEYVLSKQILRSGTSIGANVREAEHAQSLDDFIHKNYIALKEAGETEYWLELLLKTNFISEKVYHSLQADCSELNKILISTVRTSKEKREKESEY